MAVILEVSSSATSVHEAQKPNREPSRTQSLHPPHTATTQLHITTLWRHLSSPAVDRKSSMATVSHCCSEVRVSCSQTNPRSSKGGGRTAKIVKRDDLRCTSIESYRSSAELCQCGRERAFIYQPSVGLGVLGDLWSCQLQFDAVCTISMSVVPVLVGTVPSTRLRVSTSRGPDELITFIDESPASACVELFAEHLYRHV